MTNHKHAVITQTNHKHHAVITQTNHKHHAIITQTNHRHQVVITQTNHEDHAVITQTNHKDHSAHVSLFSCLCLYYIMCVCLFSAFSHRVGALQISIIIITYLLTLTTLI